LQPISDQTPEQFGQQIWADLDRFARVVRSAGLSP
jgi:hypothetical protein